MMRLRQLLTVLLLMAVWSAWAQTGKKPLYREGQVIVKFKSGPNKARGINADGGVNAALQLIGGTKVEQLMPRTCAMPAKSRKFIYKENLSDYMDLSGIYVLQFDKSQSVEKTIEKLKKLDEVEYAEPNRIVHIASTDVDTYMAEPRYDEQWGLKAIRMPELWAQPIINAKRPVIAILDTGVDMEHPDLQANLLTGYNAIDDSNDVTDEQGHGTHCAGIAAAIGNNGIGITGANPNALILPIKVFGSDAIGSMSDVYKGLDYAIAQGADIISMSLGYENDIIDEIEYEVLKSASSSAIIVAAAGNEGICMKSNHTDIHSTFGEFSKPFFPAAYDCVIGVQSTDIMGRRSSFSNYDCDGPLYTDFEKGLNYEIKAPGSAILSTFNNHDYRTMDGTSMACPLVAGAISRLLQCKNIESHDRLVRTLIETSNDCIDIMAAYQYTVDMLNAETFTEEYNGVSVTFHKTSTSTVEVGNGSSAAIPVATSGALAIPETARGYLVTGIAPNAFKDCTLLTSLYLPSSIATIGSAAFNNCSSLSILQMMEMPWSVPPDCANDAFDNALYSSCKLEVIEDHVSLYQRTDVWNLFANIQEPQYAIGGTFAETIDGIEQIFRITNMVPKTVEICGLNRELVPLRELTKEDSISVRIPTEVKGFTVTKIADKAFYWRNEMEALDIPETITEIGGGAFYCCYGLRSLHIPASVVYIKSDIVLQGFFSKCPSPQAAHTTTNIGYRLSDDYNNASVSFGTFWCMGLLESVSVAEDNPNYYSQTGTIIENASKTLILGSKGAVIPEGITAIAPNAFSHQNIGSIDIPEGVTIIGDYAFYNAHLTEIKLPNSLKDIGVRGLACNFDLKEFNIPSGVETLGISALNNNNACRTIKIPANVKKIGDNAIGNFTSLRYIIVEHEKPIDIPENVFDILSFEDVDIYEHFYDYTVLYVPKGSKTAYQNAKGWKQFNNIMEISDVILGDVDGNGLLDDMDRQVMEAYLIRYTGTYYPELIYRINQQYLREYLAGNELPDIRDIAADINNDGEIDLRDYVILINLLSGNTYNPDACEPKGSLSVDNSILPHEGYEDMVVRMQNMSNITAMILEVKLPQVEGEMGYDDRNGPAENSIQLSSRLSKTHSITPMNEGSRGGSRRYILTSPNNDIITSTEQDAGDELLRIHIFDTNTDIEKKSDVFIKAFMVSTSGKAVEFSGNWEVKPQLVFAPGQQWQTFYSYNPRIMEKGKGAKVYAVTNITSQNVIVEEIPDGIPHWQMVLVGLDEIPTETTYVSLGMIEAYIESPSNILQGGLMDTNVNPYETYILCNNEFVLNSGTTVPAGKGYISTNEIQALTMARQCLSIVGGGVLTSIQNVDANKKNELYDLQGRKISGNPIHKGLYIKNRSKIVVR